jgi:tRNA(Arg) A34 adenosine deaminase TadA
MNIKHIETALKLAEDVEPFGNAKVAAVLTYKNRAIAYGFNSNKSHPLTIRYAKNCHAIYLHAELTAIKNALKRMDDLSKTTLYVARVRKINGMFVPGIAKPCGSCAEYIIEYGIKRIVWTTDIFGEYGIST